MLELPIERAVARAAPTGDESSPAMGPTLRAGYTAASERRWDEAVGHFGDAIGEVQYGGTRQRTLEARAWYALALSCRGHGGDVERAAALMAETAAWWLASENQHGGPAPADDPVASAAVSRLSAREIEVLGHVAAGETNMEIAQSLSISVHTVIRHVTHILTKLAVPNRAAAAVIGQPWLAPGATPPARSARRPPEPERIRRSRHWQRSSPT